MWIALVGSRSIGDCSCDRKEKHWPPTDDEIAHRSECLKIAHWLLCLKVITRLVTQHPELTEPVKPKEPVTWGVVSGGAPGADTLLMEAAKTQGIPEKRRKVIPVPPGSTPFRDRALGRNTKIVDKAADGMVIALFGPGRRSPGTTDTVTKALTRGIPVHVWQDGRWGTS